MSEGGSREWRQLYGAIPMDVLAESRWRLYAARLLRTSPRRTRTACERERLIKAPQEVYYFHKKSDHFSSQRCSYPVHGKNELNAFMDRYFHSTTKSKSTGITRALHRQTWDVSITAIKRTVMPSICQGEGAMGTGLATGHSGPLTSISAASDPFLVRVRITASSLLQLKHQSETTHIAETCLASLSLSPSFSHHRRR